MDASEYNKFRQCLVFVLEKEGGYVFDPNDLGGETKWGISKRAHPELDIKNLSPERAASIYLGEYWVPAHCNDYDYPDCLAIFDTAVNMGVGRSQQFITDPWDVDAYLDKRALYYANIVKAKPAQQKFLKGWLNRITDLRKALQVARQNLDSHTQPAE